MHKDPMLLATRDVIESGTKATKHVIAAGRGATRQVLGACDRVWQDAATTLAAEPALITQKLRGDLISVQGQLTLLAGYFVGCAADRGDRMVDGVASTTTSAVSEYEHVFDARVAQAISRLGMPIAEVIRALVRHIADLSADLARLTSMQEERVVVRKTQASKKTSRRAHKAVRRGKRAKTAK